MAVETETDRLIFLNPNDFGSDDITYKSRPIAAIFDNQTVEIDGATGVTYLQEQPMVEVRTSDIVGIEQDDEFVVGDVVYAVKEWFEDGKGMTKVHLEKQ